MEQLNFYTLIIENSNKQKLLQLDFCTSNRTEKEFKIAIKESIQAIINKKGYSKDTLINTITFKDNLYSIYNIENLIDIAIEMKIREFEYIKSTFTVTLSTEDSIKDL